MIAKRISNIDIKKAVSKIKGIQTKAGFFGSSKYEDGTSVASVAIMQEYGVPQNNTPPRAFMRPAKINNENKWKNTFQRTMMNAFADGNFSKPFEIIGMVVQGDIKKAIKDVTAPALKESTVRARLRGKKQGKSVSPTITKPLIDSGYMLNSVQYEVSK